MYRYYPIKITLWKKQKQPAALATTHMQKPTVHARAAAKLQKNKK